MTAERKPFVRSRKHSRHPSAYSRSSESSIAAEGAKPLAEACAAKDVDVDDRYCGA